MRNKYSSNNFTLTFIILLIVAINGCSKKEKQNFELPSQPEIQKSSNNKLNSPTIDFKEVAEVYGIEFIHTNGAEGDKLFPESMMGGIGFIDYNNDDFADLVAVAGSSVKNAAESKSNNIAIYKNEEGKRFVNVTEDLGLMFLGYGQGLTIGDFDADGYDDLYITAFGMNKLYKNERGEGFKDITDEMEVGGDQRDFSTAASFVDIDNDGDLDLFVGNYLNWSIDKNEQLDINYDGANRMYPHPNSFSGSVSKIYINQYPQPFTELNLGKKEELTKALGVLPVDLNDDNLIDFVVANDSIKNFAFINQGNGEFIEQADSLGLSYNNLGLPTAAMGMDGAWLGRDKSFNIAMGNFTDEMTSFYRYNSHGFFVDVSPLIGIGGPTRTSFTWGVIFADLDLDGQDEFIQINSNVEPDIQKVQSNLRYRQSPQVFWQCNGSCERQFIQLDVSQLGDFSNPIAGRGIAYADIDHDGDLDFAISSIQERVRLYRNDTDNQNNWIAFTLYSKTKTCSTVGTTISIKYNGVEQKKRMMPTKGYLSHSESAVYFGLGKAELVDHITIQWPDGSQDIMKDIKANKRYSVGHE
ncbi:MAG: CRTAC1 family protein [Glaciecola sp.]|jgi:hypothetical protein